MENQRLVAEINIGIKKLMDSVKEANRELAKINDGKDYKEIDIRADIDKVKSEVQQLNQVLERTPSLNIDTTNATAKLDQFKQKMVSVTNEAGESVQKLLSDMAKLNLGTGVKVNVKQGYDFETQQPTNPIIDSTIDFAVIEREKQRIHQERVREEEVTEKRLQEEYVRGWTAKINEVEDQRLAVLRAEEEAEKQLQREYLNSWQAKIREVEQRSKNEQSQKISDQNSLYGQQEQLIKQIYQTDLKMITAKENEKIALSQLKELDIQRLNLVKQDISNKKLVNQEKEMSLKAQEVRYQQQLNVAEAKQLDIMEKQDARLSNLTGGKSFMGKLFNSAAYLSSYYILNAIQTTIKDSIGFTNQLNKAQTNIQMITGMTSDRVAQLTKNYSELASQLHDTTSNVMTASEEFLRAGNNAEQTAKLIEASTLMSKIAGTSQQEAAQSLIAIMNSYKMSAEEMIRVVDKMVAIDNTSATSTKELSAAIKDTAQSAQLAGSSFDNIISYIGTVSSVSRKSADTIGQAFKTIYQRFGSIREGMDADEFGEDISNVEKDLASIGIQLRSDVGTFKNFDVVIQELSSKWANLSDVQKSQITQDLAGNRQREILLTLLNNMNMALKMQTTEANSAGNALARYSVYAQSTEAKMNDLVNAIQKMWIKTMSSDLINGVLDALTKVINVFSNLGGIIPVVAGILSGVLVAAIGSAIVWIKALEVEATRLNVLMGGLPLIVGLVVSGLTALGFALSNITTEYETLNKKQKQLESSYSTLIQRSEESITSKQGETRVIESLASKLEYLTGQENLNVAQKQEMKAIVDQLNQKLPNLNLQIDEQTGKIKGNTNAIYDNIEALKAQAIAQGYQQKASAAGTAFANQEELLGQTQSVLSTEQQKLDLLYSKYGTAMDEINALRQKAKEEGLSYEGLGRAIAGINTKYGTANIEQQISAQTKKVAEYSALVQKQTEELNNYGDAIDNYTSKVLEYTPKIETPTQSQQSISNYNPLITTNTGSSPADQVPEYLKLEIDRYTELTSAMNDATNALSRLKAEEDTVDGQAKIDLLNKEIEANKKLWQTKNDILWEQRKERSDLRSLMEGRGFEFSGAFESTNLATNYASGLQGMYDYYNAMPYKTDEQKNARTEYLNGVKEVEKVYARILQLNKETYDTENDMIGIDKGINKIISDRSDLQKSFIKARADLTKEITSMLEAQYDAEEQALKDEKQYLIDSYRSKVEDEKESYEESLNALEEYINDRKEQYEKDFENSKKNIEAKYGSEIEAIQRLNDLTSRANDERKYQKDQTERKDKLAKLEDKYNKLSRDNSGKIEKEKLDIYTEMSKLREEISEAEIEHGLKLDEDASNDKVKLLEEERDRLIRLAEQEKDARISALDEISDAQGYSVQDYKEKIKSLEEELKRFTDSQKKLSNDSKEKILSDIGAVDDKLKDLQEKQENMTETVADLVQGAWEDIADFIDKATKKSKEELEELKLKMKELYEKAQEPKQPEVPTTGGSGGGSGGGSDSHYYDNEIAWSRSELDRIDNSDMSDQEKQDAHDYFDWYVGEIIREAREAGVEGYSTGAEKGLITKTGIIKAHGSDTKPELMLNYPQLMNLGEIISYIKSPELLLDNLPNLNLSNLNSTSQNSESPSQIFNINIDFDNVKISSDMDLDKVTNHMTNSIYEKFKGLGYTNVIRRG